MLILGLAYTDCSRKLEVFVRNTLCLTYQNYYLTRIAATSKEDGKQKITRNAQARNDAAAVV